MLVFNLAQEEDSAGKLLPLARKYEPQTWSKPFIPCILCESLMAVPPLSQVSLVQSLHCSEPIPPHPPHLIDLISSQQTMNSLFPTTHNSFFNLKGYEPSVWCISVSISLWGSLGRLQKTDRDKAGQPSSQCEVDKMWFCWVHYRRSPRTSIGFPQIPRWWWQGYDVPQGRSPHPAFTFHKHPSWRGYRPGMPKGA